VTASRRRRTALGEGLCHEGRVGRCIVPRAALFINTASSVAQAGHWDKARRSRLRMRHEVRIESSTARTLRNLSTSGGKSNACGEWKSRQRLVARAARGLVQNADTVKPLSESRRANDRICAASTRREASQARCSLELGRSSRHGSLEISASPLDRRNLGRQLAAPRCISWLVDTLNQRRNASSSNQNWNAMLDGLARIGTLGNDA
jgi:hypothetical protein